MDLITKMEEQFVALEELGKMGVRWGRFPSLEQCVCVCTHVYIVYTVCS